MIDTYCQNTTIFKPSRKDTVGTIRAAAIHNETYRRLCKGKK